MSWFRHLADVPPDAGTCCPKHSNESNEHLAPPPITFTRSSPGDDFFEVESSILNFDETSR